MPTRIKEVNWGPALFLIIYQVVLIIALPFYFYYCDFPSWGMFISAFILLYATGMSITAGYHRYYSHRSFKTNNIIETILLFLGSMAAQGSALRWSFDHRRHHAHVDTDNDPYSIKKGFWYAHFLWLLDKPQKIEEKTVPDLLKNKLVMFQHRYYISSMIVSNALVTLFFGWLLNDYLGAFFIVCWLRLFTLHHFTWFINSLAHKWGDKPFCQELSAVDNYFLSLLTFGEGYHNYHHTFANDYRNGIRWYHFDPTKWLIWTLNKLGFAHHLRRTDNATIQKRVVLESKNILLERIKVACFSKKDEIEKAINEMSEQMVEKIAAFNKLKEEYLRTKKEELNFDVVDELRRELKNLKRSLKADWRRWMSLYRSVMNQQEPLLLTTS